MGSVGHNLFGSPAVVSVTAIDNGGRGVTVTKETRDEKEKGVEGVGDESSTQTTDTTTPRGNRSSQITFQTCGDRVSVTVTRGDTNADALRDAGIDPVELSAWVAGDVGNTTTDERNEKKHVSLAQTYEDVLTSSTYLER
jgi:arginine decarboxylase-like protein